MTNYSLQAMQDKTAAAAAAAAEATSIPRKKKKEPITNGIQSVSQSPHAAAAENTSYIAAAIHIPTYKLLPTSSVYLASSSKLISAMTGGQIFGCSENEHYTQCVSLDSLSFVIHIRQ